MTWMDSYCRVHMLDISMMDCDDDVRGYVECVNYLLAIYGMTTSTIMWAVSAWMALADAIDGGRIPQAVDRGKCVEAAHQLAAIIDTIVWRRTHFIEKEDSVHGNNINAGND